MDSRGNVTPEETRQSLRKLYLKDEETNLQAALLLALSDDLKPVDPRGRRRPSSLLILVALLVVVLIAIFVYFSFGRP
jgi:hypothetical protein